MELFGGLLLAIQTLMRRHGLKAVDLSPFSGYIHSLLTNVTGSASVAAPLASLPADQRSLVASWISALYGNDGIGDELIRATSPRIFLRIAPTIVDQSCRALQSGLINLDSEYVESGI